MNLRDHRHPNWQTLRRTIEHNILPIVSTTIRQPTLCSPNYCNLYRPQMFVLLNVRIYTPRPPRQPTHPTSNFTNLHPNKVRHHRLPPSTTMAPGGFASIALARQLYADRTDRACQDNWKMVRQVAFHNPAESTPDSSQLLQGFAASPPQIYSPTSAKAPAERVVEASGSTGKFDRMLNASVSAPIQGTAKMSRLSPAKQFERMLDEELRERRRKETERAERIWWW